MRTKMQINSEIQEGIFVLEFLLTISPVVFALILQHFITSSRLEDSYDNIKQETGVRTQHRKVFVKFSRIPGENWNGFFRPKYLCGYMQKFFCISNVLSYQLQNLLAWISYPCVLIIFYYINSSFCLRDSLCFSHICLLYYFLYLILNMTNNIIVTNSIIIILCTDQRERFKWESLMSMRMLSKL